MKKNFVCLLLLVWFFVACMSPDRSALVDPDKVVSVDIDRAGTLVFSEVFDTVEYVPLEINDTFLIGYPSHLKISGDKLYFICRKSFYMYDARTGKALLKIARAGKGPGEYKSLFDAYVDDSLGTVELLDNNGRKLHVYDRQGQFMQSYALPFTPFAFTKVSFSEYWFYNNHMLSDATSCKVVHYDLAKGNIIDNSFP